MGYFGSFFDASMRMNEAIGSKVHQICASVLNDSIRYEGDGKPRIPNGRILCEADSLGS